MDPLPIIALVTIATLYGFLWHNQSAREPARLPTKPKTSEPKHLHETRATVK